MSVIEALPEVEPEQDLSFIDRLVKESGGKLTAGEIAEGLAGRRLDVRGTSVCHLLPEAGKKGLKPFVALTAWGGLKGEIVYAKMVPGEEGDDLFAVARTLEGGFMFGFNGRTLQDAADFPTERPVDHLALPPDQVEWLDAHAADFIHLHDAVDTSWV